jgi:hypothetical protein
MGVAFSNVTPHCALHLLSRFEPFGEQDLQSVYDDEDSEVWDGGWGRGVHVKVRFGTESLRGERDGKCGGNPRT